MAQGRKWTAEEIEEAIALYLVTPFGKLHSSNKKIIELASQLNRTVGSVALKLVNLASIDETLDRKGMSNFSKLDKETWDRVMTRLFESAAQISDPPTEVLPQRFAETEQARFEYLEQSGADRFVVSTSRQGQAKFREMILANYNNKCAISGLEQSELLIAGHISPWANDKQNRMNPSNGILLNRLHDKAFENGLVAISDEAEILYSDQLEKTAYRKLRDIELDGKLSLPSKFRPDFDLIRNHRNSFACNWIR